MEHDIVLPDVFRYFFTHIGGSGAAPFYGLMPLERYSPLIMNPRGEPGTPRGFAAAQPGEPDRDLFLHVRDGQVDDVCAALGERLGDLAEVVAVEELIAEGVFSEPSPQLRARLANVVVLPRYGEAVYWHEPGRFEQHLHGQHGGLSPQEMEIPLVAWVA